MKRILLSIAILLLCVSVAYAWTLGRLRVNGESQLLGPVIVRGYYHQRYNGTFRNAFTVDYTGSGNNIFDFQADGVSILTLTKAGALTLAGSFGTGVQTASLGVGATTFAATRNYVILTGDGGANTIATITGGVDGQVLTIEFVDGLITITDDDVDTANSIDLAGTGVDFTGADDNTLTISFNGTSWKQTGRSIN